MKFICGQRRKLKKLEAFLFLFSTKVKKNLNIKINNFKSV